MFECLVVSFYNNYDEIQLFFQCLHLLVEQNVQIWPSFGAIPVKFSGRKEEMHIGVQDIFALTISYSFMLAIIKSRPNGG